MLDPRVQFLLLYTLLDRLYGLGLDEERVSAWVQGALEPAWEAIEPADQPFLERFFERLYYEEPGAHPWQPGSRAPEAKERLREQTRGMLRAPAAANRYRFLLQGTGLAFCFSVEANSRVEALETLRAAFAPPHRDYHRLEDVGPMRQVELFMAPEEITIEQIIARDGGEGEPEAAP